MCSIHSSIKNTPSAFIRRGSGRDIELNTNCKHVISEIISSVFSNCLNITVYKILPKRKNISKQKVKIKYLRAQFESLPLNIFVLERRYFKIIGLFATR